MIRLAQLVCLLSLLRHGAAKRPVHLVHVLADDLGYNDVSWHNPVMKTPTLQKLRDEGIFLQNMHTWKACAPSRGSIQSGRYPFHYGFYNNQDANAYGLPTNFSTLAELLFDAGYSTHMVGKWHLGFRSEALTPTRRGFETYLGYYQHGEDYYTHVFDTKCGRPGVDFNNATTSDHTDKWRLDGFNGTYSAFIFAAEAQRVIRAHVATYGTSKITKNGKPVVTKPLYLYIPMQNVHAPIEVPARFEAEYDGVITDSKRKSFAGMVTALDEAVANITSTLKEEGLWQDCVFLFNSDNGGPLGSANNYPLRGGKFTYWDGGVRITAFIMSPRTDIIPTSMIGSTWAGLAHTVDVMPTFLAAAGVAFDPDSTYHGPLVPPIPFDGLNLLPAIQSNGSSPRTEVVHMIDNAYNPAICNQSNGGCGGQGHSGAAIQVGDFKLIVGYPGNDIWEKPPEWLESGTKMLDAMAIDSPPSCSTTSFLNNTCIHNDQGQLTNFSTKSAALCCGACADNSGCGAWSFELDSVCVLKTLTSHRVGKPGKCTSGITRSVGPTPCNMTTGYGCLCNPPSRGCLFRVSDDPNEHVDLANDPAFAADFERLLARLQEVSKTGVVGTRAMLGNRQGNQDGIDTCKQVQITGHFQPYASHTPYLPYPAPN